MDHARFTVCVGSRTKVYSRCPLLSSLLLVTVLVCPAFAQTPVVSLSTQFDGFTQQEFFDLDGIVMNGQTLSVDFKFADGAVLESIAPVWAELLLQTQPHGSDGDYPYDQYVVFGPGTTAHLIGASGQRLDVSMSDWNGSLTASPGPTLGVLSTARGLAGGDMLAYPGYREGVSGIHYDIVLPNTGEVIYVGRIGLQMETQYRRIPITALETPAPPPPAPPPPVPEPVPDPPPPDVVLQPPSDPNATRFAIADLGAASFTSRRDGAFVGGYGRIQPDPGSTSPSGMLIVGLRFAGVLTGEAIVPDSALMSSGRIYVEQTPDGRVTTGIFVANPNAEDATINFELRNEQGIIYRIGSFTLRGAAAPCVESFECNQVSRMLDEAPFLSGRDVQGTVTFTSTVPVAVSGIRLVSNPLITAVPVIDLSAGPSSGTQVVPLFTIGEGRRSELMLVNPTGATLTGRVEFVGPDGNLVFIPSGGGYVWATDYFIAPNGIQKIVLGEAYNEFKYGSVRVIPDNGGAAPVSSVINTYVQNGMTTELGVPANTGMAFRIPAEQLPGQVSTSVSIVNSGDYAGTVWLNLTDSGGNLLANTSRYMPGSGMILEGIDSLFPAFAGQQLRGVLRVTTDLPGISVAAFRAHNNELQQVVYATIPSVLENGLQGSGERFFPFLLSGTGFAIDGFLFSGKSGQSSVGSLRFVQSEGSPLNLEIGN